jgi:imidazolonepropionase-like amidohydrolase
MAIPNGARALRRPDLGTLAAGQVADVLVLSEDPQESAAAFGTLDAVIHVGVWTGRGE